MTDSKADFDPQTVKLKERRVSPWGKWGRVFKHFDIRLASVGRDDLKSSDEIRLDKSRAC
jgi:hypothetical protein